MRFNQGIASNPVIDSSTQLPWKETFVPNYTAKWQSADDRGFFAG